MRVVTYVCECKMQEVCVGVMHVVSLTGALRHSLTLTINTALAGRCS